MKSTSQNSYETSLFSIYYYLFVTACAPITSFTIKIRNVKYEVQFHFHIFWFLGYLVPLMETFSQQCLLILCTRTLPSKMHVVCFCTAVPSTLECEHWSRVQHVKSADAHNHTNTHITCVPNANVRIVGSYACVSAVYSVHSHRHGQRTGHIFSNPHDIMIRVNLTL